jgi:hypothetical protein
VISGEVSLFSKGSAALLDQQVVDLVASNQPTSSITEPVGNLLIGEATRG